MYNAIFPFNINSCDFALHFVQDTLYCILLQCNVKLIINFKCYLINFEWNLIEKVKKKKKKDTER